MNVMGIDIGGSKIIFVLLKNNKVLRWQKIATPKKKNSLIEAIKKNISKVDAIGIGVPGPLNEKGDLILNPPNLPFLNYLPLAKIISKETGIKTKMENDANCFALAEAKMGAGHGARFVVGVTLGTGVGGGIVIDSRLYRGAFGSAGEPGHMTIKYDGIECACGRLGCLEAYCSEKFFLRKGISPKKSPLSLFREYGRFLGIGIANIVNILDPEVVILGGGLANAYNKFIKEAEESARENIISSFSRKYVKIKKAKLGELAGATGAALLWQK